MKSVLIISGRDNVGTALVRIEAGEAVHGDGATLLVQQTIPAGHKVALRAIAAGENVMKYGAPIGTATAPIPAGTHVHTHNVASTRGRGDLSAGAQRADGP
jgi:altronate hydrolase